MFPASLAAYELAFDDALKRVAGSGWDRLGRPDERDIEDAYFQRKTPLEFAERFFENSKWALPIKEEKEEHRDEPGEAKTLELF